MRRFTNSKTGKAVLKPTLISWETNKLHKLTRSNSFIYLYPSSSDLRLFLRDQFNIRWAVRNSPPLTTLEDIPCKKLPFAKLPLGNVQLEGFVKAP
jgi:hypothetical protein